LPQRQLLIEEGKRSPQAFAFLADGAVHLGFPQRCEPVEDAKGLRR
jgi:hypothetical protein